MRHGRRISCGGIRLVYRRNSLGHARLGLAVSRRFGNAVQRNRFKRRIREAFRTRCLKMEFDLLVIPLKPAQENPHPAADFLDAVRRLERQSKS